jgi:hypothetical protein
LGGLKIDQRLPRPIDACGHRKAILQRLMATRAGDDENPGTGGQRAEHRDGLTANARQRMVAAAPRESGHLPCSSVVEVEKGSPARRLPV